jgi:HSP20 family protein
MILLRRGRPAQLVGHATEVELAFDLGPAPGRARQSCYTPWRPPIEVFETDDDLVVRAEIGGIVDGQMHVALDGEDLVIGGERTVGHPDNSRMYHESRIRYGPFRAVVRVPFPVDAQAATAEYLDGFLTVTLPRRVATKIAPRKAARSGGILPGEQ